MNLLIQNQFGLFQDHYQDRYQDDMDYDTGDGLHYIGGDEGFEGVCIAFNAHKGHGGKAGNDSADYHGNNERKIDGPVLFWKLLVEQAGHKAVARKFKGH